MSLPSTSIASRHAALATDALGPVKFMNPTACYVAIPKVPPAGGTVVAGEGRKMATGDATKDELPRPTAASASPEALNAWQHVYHVWRSRDNRKGRHAVVVSRAFYLDSLRRHVHVHVHDHDHGHKEKAAATRHAAALQATNSLRETLRGVGKMVIRWPVWDISFDVALLFTLGSAIWVVNAFFVWLPLQAPSTAFANESGTGGGVSALVGATVFEVGALLGMLEAVNETRGDCFGWALEEEEEEEEEVVAAGPGRGMPQLQLQLRPRPDSCRHHQAQRRRLLGAIKGSADTDGQPSPTTPASLLRYHRHRHRHRQWSWCPSWHELRTHYLHEIGFWACATQVVAATIFWISGFTGLPPVLDQLSLVAQNGIFWLPQVVGGAGFVTSSLLFMLETQPCWYIPAPCLLGWHIGLWNLVGSLGFTLCGAFGFAATQSYDMEYASSLSTFIGSWAFLIGSIIQWYESLDKYPVAIKQSIRSTSTRREPGPGEQHYA